MIDLIGFGHCCADYLSVLKPFPDKGKKGDVIQSLTIGGGPVPTACQTVSLFGKSARFIGKVGDDEDGKLVIEGLQRCSVDSSYMLIDSSVRTARASIWIDAEDGSRTVALDVSNFQFPRASEVNVEWLSECRMLLIDGRAGDATLLMLHEAKRRGILTMLDAGAVRQRLDEMLPFIDYAVVSSDFADTYSPGASKELLAGKLIQAGVGTAVITAGEKGAYWQHKTDSGFVEGYRISPVIDTTGAGDVFHGGLIFGILEGWNFQQSLRFANAAAALSTRRLSGRGGIPELTEVMNLIDSK